MISEVRIMSLKVLSLSPPLSLSPMNINFQASRTITSIRYQTSFPNEGWCHTITGISGMI